MNDTLDALLTSSAPELAEPHDRLIAELATMANAARAEARPVRRLPRAVATGVAVALLIGGAGAAAAVSRGDWQPWAEHADYAYAYTLPSGKRCEARIGDFTGSDPELLAAVTSYLASGDILSRVDVDAEIAEIREGESVMVFGTRHEPAGYGTKYYDEDQEYQQAIDNGVRDALYAEMESQGFHVEGGLESFLGETHCDA